MKDRGQDPWTVFTTKYGVGDTANVKVVKLMTFGAFAEIVPGVDGLIHISQIADHRIEKPGDVLAEGDKVDVKITDVDMAVSYTHLGGCWTVWKNFEQKGGGLIWKNGCKN